MVGIVCVCTGNICRSPLAAHLLATRLADLDVRVTSAGTRARPGMGVTQETLKVAVRLGGMNESLQLHSASFLNDSHLSSADLALAMGREHRRAIVELDPPSVRKAFTLRELSRLVTAVGEDGLVAATNKLTPSERLSDMLALLSSGRGVLAPPVSLDDDDVVDPYRRSERTYALSASQVTLALPAVETLIRLAFATGTRS